MTWFLATFEESGSWWTSQVNSVCTWKMFEEKTLRYREFPKAPLYLLRWSPTLDLLLTTGWLARSHRRPSVKRANRPASPGPDPWDPTQRQRWTWCRNWEFSLKCVAVTSYAPCPTALHKAVIAALLVNHENPAEPPCTTSLTIGCFPRYQCSHRQLYALAGTGAFFAARWHAVFFHSAAALLQNCWLEGACWVWDSLQKIHTQDWVPFKPI